MMTGHWRESLASSSLLVRFGAASAALAVGLGLVLGWVLNSTVKERALVQSESTVASVGRLAVQPMLAPEDFVSGRVHPERLVPLSRGVADLINDGTVARVKVFNQQGTVLYSSDQQLIGETQQPEEGLEHALDGTVDSELQS